MYNVDLPDPVPNKIDISTLTAPDPVPAIIDLSDLPDADALFEAWIEARSGMDLRAAFLAGFEAGGIAERDALPVQAFSALLDKFQRLLLIQEAARIKVKEHPTRERLLDAMAFALENMPTNEQAAQLRRLAGLSA